MALDWIKMRTDIYRDPKVIIIADLLMDKDSDLAAFVSQVTRGYMTVTRNVTRNAVVGALVSVWGVIRHQGERVGDDLLIRGATDSAVDDIADLPGLGVAMSQVGWVVTTDDGIVFPGFFNENNADPNEVRKARNAEKQRRYREKTLRNKTVTRDVTRDHEVTTREREEKEREKSIKEPPIPPEGGAADAANVDEQDGTDIDDPEFSTSSMAFVVGEWNLVGATKSRKISKKVAGYLRARLKDPWWMTHWQEALEQLPKCKGIWGDNDRGWKCNFEWFVRPDTVQNIIEGGKYGNSSPNATGCPVPATGGRRTTTESSLDAIGRFAARYASGGSQGISEPLCLEANG